MRKHFLIFTLLILAVSASAQDKGKSIIDDYGKHPVNKRQAVKFDLALKLLTGNYSDVKRDIILRAINAPDTSLESDVMAAFTPSEARSIFYDLCNQDISDLKAIYSLASGKSAVVKTWTKGRVNKLWQQNLALGFVRFDFNYAQQLYLIDLAHHIDAITLESSDMWDQAAVVLFTDRAMGRALFATVGNSICPNVTARLGKKAEAPTCVCTTVAGNWSCNDSCHGEGTCSIDPGNCGFLWLRDCNGMCNVGDMEIQ